MAEIYDSEQEQLDELKRWWKENGTTVTIGLVLGLGGVFGWTAWKDYRQDQAEAASALYQRQSTALGSQDYAAADQAGAELLEQYGSSGYAGLAALVLAKSAFEQGRPADARRHLQWVLDNGSRRELKLTARLRMAQLLFDDGDHEAALALLAAPELGPFQASYDELRADILVAQGHANQARAAYNDALGRIDDASPARRRVQMKLDDLGHTNIPTG